MKLHHFTEDERKIIGVRLARLIKAGVRKCEVARATGLPWQLVHMVAELKRLPHPLTCMVLRPWLDAKEKEPGLTPPIPS